jgi:hypothetical protein
MLAKQPGSAEMWVLDSGASKHMCCDEQAFSRINKSDTTPIQVGNGELLRTKGKGTVVLTCPGELRLQDVLLVPGLSANLVSVHELFRQGYEVVFRCALAEILDCTYRVVARFFATAAGLYVLQPEKYLQTHTHHTSCVNLPPKSSGTDV